MVRKARAVACAFIVLLGMEFAGAQGARLDALTLRDSEQVLALKSREFALARRNLDLARADTLVAGARPNPTLSLGVGAINPQAGIGAGRPHEKTVDSSARIDQLIERGNKRDLRIDFAKRVEDAVASDASEVLRQQRLVLASTYFDLLLAQDKVTVANDNVALFDRTLEAAERRLRAGDIAAADLSRIKVDALRAANDMRQAEGERARARVALGYLIGAEAEVERIRAVDPWPSLAAREAVEIDAAIERRPDVRAAQARVTAAQSARELARSLRTRDISVGAQFDRYPTSATNQNGSGNSFGFSVSVPLFVRYYYEGEIARAEAAYDAAIDALERTRAIARTELAAAGAALQTAAERVRRYDESLLAEAGRSAEYAEFAYRNGAIGVMDLLDSRRVLRATQFDAVQARADYAKALAAWRAGLAAEVQ